MKNEEAAAELDSKLNQGVVHTSTNPFVLAFRGNEDISAFLDEIEKEDEPIEKAPRRCRGCRFRSQNNRWYYTWNLGQGRGPNRVFWREKARAFQILDLTAKMDANCHYGPTTPICSYVGNV
ncbi:Elongation factor Ts [Forsythia ovata]|uniref:Elongation factor Ts n=1 Tax=Forsythia ovata TaxID=205694 RepID=A0ABD1PFV0_9LAMI